MAMKNKFYKITFCVYILFLFGFSGINRFNFVSANSTDLPPPRYGHAMVFDSNNNQTILFGGYNEDISLDELSTTWIFSSVNLSWTEIDSEQAPDTRFDHSMVYNSNSGKTLLFGGISTQIISRVNDTWEFDPNTNNWTELHPSSAPSPRSGHAMYFDKNFNEVILQGGSEYNEVYGDTWIYNCSANTWHQVFPITQPGLKYGHSSVYDEEQQVGVFYGGRFGNGLQVDETWFFNRSSLNWVRQHPPLSPIRRYFTSMVYNPYLAEIMMFGGDYEQNPLRAVDDTWIFDTSSVLWSKIYPEVKPIPRAHHSMVFDTYLNKALLFGGVGEDYSRVFDDIWFYDFITMNWSEDFSSSTANTSLWILFVSLGGILVLVNKIKNRKIRKEKHMH